MQLAIIGTGYVGLVTGADFASRGFSVTCVDVDAERIANLECGVLPFFETGLAPLVAEGARREHLFFTTDAASAIRDADVVLVAVGTPLGEDGRADLSAVFDVATTFAAHAKKDAIFVIKSTVPPGTGARCADIVGERVVANPEFLSQGSAVSDARRPSRIVVGANHAALFEPMRELYAAFIADNVPYLEMRLESAEAAKCAANAFLATKISFMNEIANYCAKVGGDVTEVTQALGADPRIGPHFLRAGLGYGGGCLHKDVASLIADGAARGMPFRLLPQVEVVNDTQRFVLHDRLRAELGDLRGHAIAVWGLAFKSGTDDMRNAPAVDIVRRLIDDGADVVVYDPAAIQRARVHFGDALDYAPTALAALDGAEALLVLTEWEEFGSIPLSRMIERMKTPLVLDGRGVFAGQKKPEGLRYIGIGCG